VSPLSVEVSSLPSHREGTEATVDLPVRACFRLRFLPADARCAPAPASGPAGVGLAASPTRGRRLTGRRAPRSVTFAISCSPRIMLLLAVPSARHSGITATGVDESRQGRPSVRMRPVPSGRGLLASGLLGTIIRDSPGQLGGSRSRPPSQIAGRSRRRKANGAACRGARYGAPRIAPVRSSFPATHRVRRHGVDENRPSHACL
jgi:hypothetical protein